MKLKYTKPAFVMERFNLAQSIAANCTAEEPANPHSSIGDPGWGSRESCGWLVGDYIIWTELNNCNWIADVNDEVMGVCYNNPNGDNIIFQS
jgi:hypothetical protein